MKKALVAKIALAGTAGLAAALAAGTASAADCSFCHTMHNSQDGQPMVWDTADTSPKPILLRGDCVYCHSGVNTTGSLLNSPPKVYGTAATVYATTANSGTDFRNLAGGDFVWVGDDQSHGHNVGGGFGLSGDTTLNNVPPGGTDMGAQLQCAGVTGCHGLTSVTGAPIGAMKGAHHSVHNTLTNSTTYIDGATVGGSFRYLNGVKGFEDSDWQHTEDYQDHNQYAGETRTTADTVATTGTNRTISGLCARCHGAFHNTSEPGAKDAYGINTTNTNFAAGQWVRHPTDYDMNEDATGEFVSYDSYDIIAPVGRTIANLTVGADGTVTGAGYRIVLCVSCHRAHGSPYQDALRWSYGEMQVGTTGAAAGTGCFACHAAKDGA
jgi:hypothetical protein